MACLDQMGFCFPSRNLPFLQSLLGQNPTNPSAPFLQQPTSKTQRQTLALTLEDVCQPSCRGEYAFTEMLQNRTAILNSAVSIRIHHLPVWECYYPQHHTSITRKHLTTALSPTPARDNPENHTTMFVQQIITPHVCTGLDCTNICPSLPLAQGTSSKASLSHSSQKPPALSWTCLHNLSNMTQESHDVSSLIY